MRIRVLCLLLTPLICASGQGPEMVARMRDAALHYADRLQDFLCTQVMTRSVDVSGTGKKWKVLETQELEVGFIAHSEHYRLMKVNGKTTDLEKRVKKGYWTPGGEFGSELRRVFSDKAAAQFDLDHQESSAAGRACVFRYRVAAATGSMVINADADHVKVAYRGFVTADCESGNVMRLQLETEPASVTRRGREVAIGMQLDIQYGPVTVGGTAFPLPQHALEIAPFGQTLTKVEMTFQNYRKYESNSHISFDDEIIKPAQPPNVIK